ncbi:MAG: twin-arginine translocase subunit TatB [Halieaceae bacterium]|jgi:sec-independent protein translocase protein TatB|nr:twin-arginine translocase subunit TatB [Halieaceae bacterium]
MFDIGFAELLLVAIVGLLVLGPERLPEAIRTCSAWLARLKRGFDKVKADVERELNTDEIRTQLRSDAIVSSFEKDRQQLEALDRQAQSTNTELLDDLAKLEQAPSLAESGG